MTASVVKPASSVGFGDRLYTAMRTYGPVCVGIDPHASLLKEWGLDDDANGVREFSLRVIEALGGRVAAFKPQAAFFERHGSHGVAVLEEALSASWMPSGVTSARRWMVTHMRSSLIRRRLRETP